MITMEEIIARLKEILGDDYDFGTPGSPNAAILQNILGAMNELRVPQSENEALLLLIYEKISGMVVDDELSTTSTNPVQNKVITEEINKIIEGLGAKRYGVAGIGQSASALTRIYDAVGMVAEVGTDGDNSAVRNDFDTAAPFMTRKCVGTWTLTEDGRSHFNVAAYLGDDNYTEDGSIGDYVAVEYPRSYYRFENGQLIISAFPFAGYKPFDVFCVDHNPENTIEHYYHPAYALAVKDGHAVSLPGLNNEQGTYYSLTTAARTYNNDDVKSNGNLMFAAYNFYEWALFTVEFANQNCQSIMQGNVNLRSNDSDTVTFFDEDRVLTNSYQAARVVGEYIAITPNGTAHTSVSYKATHKITSIIRCDADGTENPSGNYQLIGIEYVWGTIQYDTTGETTYALAARPYATGSANSVSTPSGSPVSNASGYYPCKYRHHENPFGNQYHSSADLFNQRMSDGGNYYLDWYYLPDCPEYTPSSSSKPDATDLASNKFKKLDIGTPTTNYVDGYIVNKKYSEEYPDIWIPKKTTQGSQSTYFCDYAYLVNSYSVRLARFGGSWYYGPFAGFSSVSAHIAPSYGLATFGGDLCFSRQG